MVVTQFVTKRTFSDVAQVYKNGFDAFETKILLKGFLLLPKPLHTVNGRPSFRSVRSAD
ncbi:hypothetical protein LEP3755_46640 [Leptolyngbya sp. NIES-3755]|nr:hypothetical protein LEP3755_46640 [Leptolyngbya sp. NIES-3755]